MEKSCGVLEGKPIELWKKLADQQKIGIREFKAEKAQSWIDVNKRAQLFLQQIVDKYMNRN